MRRCDVKFTVSELAILGSLIGRTLDRVSTDGWAAEFQSGPTVISVVPEEIPTPDDDHSYGDVQRPLVRMATNHPDANMADLLGTNFGIVRAVNVISTLTAFSPVVDCEPMEIVPGVTLPSSRGYGMIYFRQDCRVQAESAVGAGALIDLDVAFEVVTDRCPSLVFYTSGYFIVASPQGLPVDEDWAQPELYSRSAAS